MLRFRRIVLLRLAVFAFTTIACLFISEGLARLVAPYPISYPWMDQINGVVAPLPNVHGRHFVPGTYDTTFSFSSQRFRGEQLYATEPGPQVVRIAMLGSSSTFGSGANDVDAYPFQLQSILQERSSREGSKLTFEVINAAIPGTVVAEQALWYENWVKRFHPHVVVLNVACAVDYVTGMFLMDESGRVTPRTPGELQAAAKGAGLIRQLAKHFPGYIFLCEHSELFHLLESEVGGVIRRRRKAVLGDQFAYPKPPGTANHLEKGALLLEAAEVVWLKERVEKAGARLAVTVLPCRENVYPSPSPRADDTRREYTAIVNVLRDVTTKEGIPFTDVASALRKTARRPQQSLYYDGPLETHPTPAGYRAIAESVAAFLLEGAVIPASGDSAAP